MSELIVYFSRAHENYFNGQIRDVKTGNTEIAAEILQQLTGADLFQLEPVQAYAKDYNQCIAQAKEDQERDARPELKAYPDLDGVDTVYLGYPNYWGTMPMPVFTFLEHYDWEGKTIFPFCTNEGSGMGTSEDDIRRLAPNAGLGKGLSIHGAEAGKSEKAMKRWVKRSALT